MSAADRTIDADRPDLEQLPTKQREGYIGTKILPIVKVEEKSSSTSYQTIPDDPADGADGAVVTGRSAGAELAAQTISSSSVTYTCSCKESLTQIDERETPAMGGIANVDFIGGRQAKHKAMKKLDAAIKTLLFTGTATDISSGVLNGLKVAADAIAKFDGKIVLALSKTSYRYLVSLEEIMDRLALSGFAYVNPGDVLSMKPNVLRDMLSQFYSIDDILIGADETWQESGLYSASLFVQPEADNPLFYKEKAVLGATFQYMPDGNQPFELHSYFDENTTTNRYRSRTYDDPKILNSGAAKYLKLGAIG